MNDEMFEEQKEPVRRYSLRDAVYFVGTAVVPAAMTLSGGALAIYGLLTKQSECAAAGSVISIAGVTAMSAFSSLDDLD